MGITSRFASLLGEHFFFFCAPSYISGVHNLRWDFHISTSLLELNNGQKAGDLSVWYWKVTVTLVRRVFSSQMQSCLLTVVWAWSPWTDLHPTTTWCAPPPPLPPTPFSRERMKYMCNNIPEANFVIVKYSNIEDWHRTSGYTGSVIRENVCYRE